MVVQAGSGGLSAATVDAQTGQEPLLDIRLVQEITPPSDKHELLLGFHFEVEPAVIDHPALINLQLEPLNCERITETWWYKGEVSFTQYGPVRLAECQDYTVAISQQKYVSPRGIRNQTRQAYLELIRAINSSSHTNLVKIWNYFGGINTGNNDLKKYRQFSVGRAEAFKQLGLADEGTPAGTAIGTQGESGLVIIALATKRDFYPVENPRQMSAFNYPRSYGPSSPKFSRGGFVFSENHNLYLISGTAAVVGHKSSFPHNTQLQLNETISNLACLCDALSARNERDTIKFVLDEQCILRVYLKNPDDYHSISAEIREKMEINGDNVVFLQGTICRQELMVEIDAVKVV